MNKQQKFNVKLSLIAMLAASTINRVAFSRETGAVAVASARLETAHPTHFLVSGALVGTGDSFKLWQGVELALARNEAGDGLIYRTDAAETSDEVENFIMSNSQMYPDDIEVFDIDNIEGAGKMAKAIDAWMQE